MCFFPALNLTLCMLGNFQLLLFSAVFFFFFFLNSFSNTISVKRLGSSSGLAHRLSADEKSPLARKMLEELFSALTLYPPVSSADNPELNQIF